MNLDISIDEAKNDEVFFKLYEKNIYDILFIEYDKNIWYGILNNILHINEKQKIIIVSDTFGCSRGNDCITCQKKYNVDVLIKPILDIKTSELFKREFICEEFGVNELQFKLMQLNKQLNLEYGSISMDLERMTYKLDMLTGHRQILALSELVSWLNDMGLKYEVLPNFDVKILSNSSKG